MPDFNTFSANLNVPQQPYSALGDMFASGLYQPGGGGPPPMSPTVYAGMQSLAMPNGPQTTLRDLTPLISGGLTMPVAGGALSANASMQPYQPQSPYVGLNFRRQF